VQDGPAAGAAAPARVRLSGRGAPHAGRDAGQGRGRQRQDGRLRGRDGERPRRHAGARRLRLHERVPGGAALPRLQDPRDRRGHHRGAAHADRARAGAVDMAEQRKEAVDGAQRPARREAVQRGLWFEEYEVGAAYLHRPGRTMTETDNVLFTTLTMNTQSLHLDAAWSAEQPGFGGERLMNSMHTLSTLVGLSVAQLTQGTIVANLGCSEVSFPKPVLHGDTLYAETVCTDKRESKSRPGEGIVTLEHIGRNQHGDIVAKAVRKTLVRKRPADRAGEVPA